MRRDNAPGEEGLQRLPSERAGHAGPTTLVRSPGPSLFNAAVGASTPAQVEQVVDDVLMPIAMPMDAEVTRVPLSAAATL